MAAAGRTSRAATTTRFRSERVHPAIRSADREALQSIRAIAFAPVFAGFRAAVGAEIAAVALSEAEAEQARLLDRICAGAEGWRLYVAEERGEAVGFVSLRLDGQMGEIGLNAVHPDAAGHGIGTALYRHALARLREMGARAAFVSTGGDAAHAPARRAYAKAGFGPAIPGLTLYAELG